MRAQGEQTLAFSMDFRCQQPIPTLTPFSADIEIPEMDEGTCHLSQPGNTKLWDIIHLVLKMEEDIISEGAHKDFTRFHFQNPQ